MWVYVYEKERDIKERGYNENQKKRQTEQEKKAKKPLYVLCAIVN